VVKVKTRIFLVVIGILISVISRLVVSAEYPYPAVWNFTSSHLGAFGLGISIAYISRSKSQLINSVRLWIFLLLNLADLFIEAITLGSKIFSGQISSLTYLQAELIFSCVILITLRSKRILFPKFLSFLGKRSYGIYTYHWPILLIFKGHMGVAYLSLVQVVGLLSFTFLLGALSYKFVEGPFLNMKPYPREKAIPR
jgi:peptidoglycan/LPS O-acetylase OafA/YrhL